MGNLCINVLHRHYLVVDIAYWTVVEDWQIVTAGSRVLPAVSSDDEVTTRWIQSQYSFCLLHTVLAEGYPACGDAATVVWSLYSCSICRLDHFFSSWMLVIKTKQLARDFLRQVCCKRLYFRHAGSSPRSTQLTSFSRRTSCSMWDSPHPIAPDPSSLLRLLLRQIQGVAQFACPFVSLKPPMWLNHPGFLAGRRGTHFTGHPQSIRTHSG